MIYYTLKRNKLISVVLAVILFVTAAVAYLPTDIISLAFGLVFVSSGQAGHPYLMGRAEGDSSETWFLCMNKGASAHSNYDYSKINADVDYHSGTAEQKRMFWAYIGAFGSYDHDSSMQQLGGGSGCTKDQARDVSWSGGSSNGGSAWVSKMASDGFMGLESIPSGCKSPNDIFNLISKYNSEDHAMYMGSLMSGPCVVDAKRLYECCGLDSWQTFMKYCTVTPVTPGLTAEVTDGSNPTIMMSFPNLDGGSKKPPAVVKITYDPGIFNGYEVTGKLEFFKCKIPGSQQLYRAKGNVKALAPLEFYLTTQWNGNAVPENPSDTGSSNSDIEISLKIYDHSETFESNYHVQLNKRDYETGKMLENSKWQVLEKFDADQLSEDESDGGIVAENMREEPVVWDDFLIFEDDLTTDKDGNLSYSDKRYYDFSHRYCNGHPLPPEPEEDGDEEDEGDDEDDAYEAAMEAWQQAVDECEAHALESGGTFHHFVSGGEEEVSVEEAFEMSGCRQARDLAYENFIHLKYSYTFRETKARDGYIVHNEKGHRDCVPIEIMTSATSEADEEAEWTSCDNSEITVSGYARNNMDQQDFERALLQTNGLSEKAEMESVVHADHDKILMKEIYELSFTQVMINKLCQFIGLKEPFTRMKEFEINVVAEAPDQNNLNYEYATMSEATISNATISNATASDAEELDEDCELFNDLETATVSSARFLMLGSNQTAHTDPIRKSVMMLRISEEDDDEDFGVYDIDYENGEPDGLEPVEPGEPDHILHQWIVYDERVPGQIHFNKQDLDLQTYGDTQGDSALEGAVYGLFAADDILGPDTQFDESGNVIYGTGVVFSANDLVSVASTDKNGDGSFMAITEIPHSVYNYDSGKIEYSGKTYPQNLYTQTGYVKEYQEEETGRIYSDHLTENGCCWIGRPLILGNYYIKELTRSEGYELSITGKNLDLTNRPDDQTQIYGKDAISKTTGRVWLKEQLDHAVTFPEGNAAYGNRENLFTLSVASSDAVNGYNVVIDGLPDNAEIYAEDIEVKPVKIKVPDGGKFVDATEEPLFVTAQDNNVLKRDQDGTPIENKEARKDVLIPYYGTGTVLEKMPEGQVSIPEDARYTKEFAENEENINYVKDTLEAMMQELGMEIYHEGDAEVDQPMLTISISEYTTNQSVIEAILHYYEQEQIYKCGGLHTLKCEDQVVKAEIYAGMMPFNKNLLYETEEDGEIVSAYLKRLNAADNSYVVRKYTGEDLQVSQNGKGENVFRLMPDFEMDASGNVIDKAVYGSMTNQYLTYQAGETLYDYWQENSDGQLVGHEPVRRKVYEVTYTEKEIMEESVSASKIPKIDHLNEVTDKTGSTYYDYDHFSGQYRLHIGSKDTDLRGNKEHTFVIAIEEGKRILTGSDLEKIGTNNVWLYKEGDTLTEAEYRIRISGAGAAVFTSEEFDQDSTYIKNQKLIYNGQYDLKEDGNTLENPNQVYERIISQRIKVEKNTFNDGYNEKTDNFRFKSYLKSNLLRLYRNDTGEICWLDRKGNEIDVLKENELFPALVSKIYTKVPHKQDPLFQLSDDAVIKNDQLYSFGLNGLISEMQNSGYTSLLESSLQNGKRIYNYEKFFEAVRTANIDKWDENHPTYTSWRPIGNLLNRNENTIFDAKVSDQVRQFAVNWYLEDEVKKLLDRDYKDKEVNFSEELHDEALKNAIIKAENYLKPFFLYDIDEIYSIKWDSHSDGGSDHDLTTLSADYEEENNFYGTSAYLPYGIYVVVEQQPEKAELRDLKNKHYQIDSPKEVQLPVVYEQEQVKDTGFYYSAAMKDDVMQKNYLIRFSQEVPHIIHAENSDGNFQIYKYGLDIAQICNGENDIGKPQYFALTQDLYKPYKNYYNEQDDRTREVTYYLSEHMDGREKVKNDYRYSSVSEHMGNDRGKPTMQGNLTAIDGCYAPVLYPWSVKSYSQISFTNHGYECGLRIEKLDSETHENILHDDAQFSIYRAKRNEENYGNGEVLFYDEETLISGTEAFLKAMGAENITPVKRRGSFVDFITGQYYGPGNLFTGFVKAGTPICEEKDKIILNGKDLFTTSVSQPMQREDDQTNTEEQKQVTGYLELPQPLEAGTYVIAEIKPPEGYVRTKPLAIEVYSNKITYYKEGNKDWAVQAVLYDDSNTARVNIENQPIKLTVEKLKETTDANTVTYKIGTRIEGSMTEIGGRDDLEYAYDSSGYYLGYAWKKGTLETLLNRKTKGENIVIAYEGDVFAGYGFVTKALEISAEENQYVKGALMTLFKAVEVTKTGDTQDFAYSGVKIERSNTNNVKRMYLEENGQDLLYYDLDSLEIFAEKYIDGQKIRYGYDKKHTKVSLDQLETDKANYDKTDTDHSIYAFKGGMPYLEFTGGDLKKIEYSKKDKILTTDENTRIYHIDRNGNRDALVDGYTGMAFVTGSEEQSDQIFAWPVNIRKDEFGNIIARDKISTSRAATIGENQDGYDENEIIDVTNNSSKPILDADKPSYTHTESGYITGSWKTAFAENSHHETTLNVNKNGQNRNDEVLTDDNNGVFDKVLKPLYDKNGLSKYYQISKYLYQNGTDLYDRNGDFVRYQDSDNLFKYNKASYSVKASANKDTNIFHRQGEAYVLENTWMSSEKTPNDPFHTEFTNGQADVIKRLPADIYIMEELIPPNGYTKGFPVGIKVAETDKMQHLKMIDKTIKIEVSKTDSPVKNLFKMIDMNTEKQLGTEMSLKGQYGYGAVENAEMTLYQQNTGEEVLKWMTREQPFYHERLEKGTYILKETKTPSGFVTASPQEICVEDTTKVQTFEISEEHTKLEISKDASDGHGKKVLPGAELTLYDGDQVVDQWISDDATDYTDTLMLEDYPNNHGITGMSGFKNEFKKLYRVYGTTAGTSFAWPVVRSAVRSSENDQVWLLEDGQRVAVIDGVITYPAEMSIQDRDGFLAAYDANLKNADTIKWLNEKRATYVSHTQIASKDTIFPNTAIMLFETEDAKIIRITIYGNSIMEYQYDYKKLNSYNDYACSYMIDSGHRRIDYLPVGVELTLKETKVPYGYAKASDQTINIKDMPDIQFYSVLNEKGKIVISKKANESNKELEGATLALYEMGENDRLVSTWVTGTDGRYTDTDYVNGLVPEGYHIGDLKPHTITGLENGSYYVKELHAPDYFKLCEPVEFVYDQKAEMKPINLIDEIAEGKLKIFKCDEDGQMLRDVVFELKAYSKATGKEVLSKTISDFEGVVELANLPVGKWDSDRQCMDVYLYKLKEIIPPDGYAVDTLIKTFSFLPDENGESYQKDQYAEYQYYVSNKKTSIEIDKRDFMNEKVIGAELTLYEVTGHDEDGNYLYDENHPFDTWMTSEIDRHTVTGMIAGRTYLLCETKCPDGYLKMKPTAITISQDGRRIQKITCNVNSITIHSIDNSEEYFDAITSLTLNGRYVTKMYVEVCDEEENIVSRWISTGNPMILTAETLVEGQLYHFSEYTVYSDGETVLSNKISKRAVFDSNGEMMISSRNDLHTEQVLMDEENNQIFSYTPNEIVSQESIDNNIKNELPMVTINNIGTETGDVIQSGQVIKNTIYYYNPTNIRTNISITANTDPQVRMIEADHNGVIDQDKVTWVIKNVEPNAGGSVSFYSELEDYEAEAVSVQTTVSMNAKNYSTVKKVPVGKKGMLTVWNELIGSGKELYKETETGFKIILTDEDGEELRGSYHYFGSREGELKSGETIWLSGNEYIFIDPGKFYRTAAYLIKPELLFPTEANYQQMHLEGNISEDEAAFGMISRKVYDDSERALFEKGKSYTLLEYTYYSDGEKKETDRIKFMLNEYGGITGIGAFDQKSHAVFYKTDITTGKELEGARISVSDEHGNIIEEWISGEHPHEIIGKLQPGKEYLMTETAAPDGYCKAESIRFKVNNDGTLDKIVMEDKPTHVVIRKTDITTGKNLEGAHLSITDTVTGEMVCEWTSDENDFDITGFLIAGRSYYLKEEYAPFGYGYAETVKFTVSMDGTIDLVEMKDELTKVKISKTDLTTGEELEGAHLQVTDFEGTVMDEWISGKTPHFVEGKLEAGKEYILTEILAPEGYVYAEQIIFSVNRDGSVKEVVMEDRRKPEVIIPHGGGSGGFTGKKVPKPELQEEKKKTYGWITSEYIKTSGKLGIVAWRERIKKYLKNPDTGDYSDLSKMIALNILSGIGALSVLVLRKRR